MRIFVFDPMQQKTFTNIYMNIWLPNNVFKQCLLWNVDLGLLSLELISSEYLPNRPLQYDFMMNTQ